MNISIKTVNANQLADIFIKANQDQFQTATPFIAVHCVNKNNDASSHEHISQINWKQVPLFKDSEIQFKN